MSTARPISLALVAVVWAIGAAGRALALPSAREEPCAGYSAFGAGSTSPCAAAASAPAPVRSAPGASAPSSIQREISTTPAIVTAMPASVAAPNAAPTMTHAKKAVQTGSVLVMGAITATRSPRRAK